MNLWTAQGCGAEPVRPPAQPTPIHPAYPVRVRALPWGGLTAGFCLLPVLLSAGFLCGAG